MRPLPTVPRDAFAALAPLLDLPAQPRLLDVACGLGAGLHALRRAWPQARLHGLTYNGLLRWLCALRCPWARVRRGDAWEADWGGYDLVYLAGQPRSTMSRALVKALAELSDGGWLLCLDAALPDSIAATHSATLADGRRLHAYRAPLAEVDHASVHASEVASLFPPAPQGIHVRGQRLYPRRSGPGGRRR